MNFLQLVQRTRRKCRVTGTGPTTVVSQAEEYARLVDFVNEAWMWLQLKRPDWRWMRNSMSFPTVSGQAVYTLAQIESTGAGFSNFGNWDKDSFRNYVTSVGTDSEFLMTWTDYDNWRSLMAVRAILLVRNLRPPAPILPKAILIRRSNTRHEFRNEHNAGRRYGCRPTTF